MALVRKMSDASVWTVLMKYISHASFSTRLTKYIWDASMWTVLRTEKAEAFIFWWYKF